MKRCEFCDHKRCTDDKEPVCVKRLICLEGIDNDFPCRDFSINITACACLAILGMAVGVLILLSLLS